MGDRGCRIRPQSFAKIATLQMSIFVSAAAAIARTRCPGVDFYAGRRRRTGVCMRTLGAVFVVFLAAHPAGAQTDKVSPSAVTAKPATQPTKFPPAPAPANPPPQPRKSQKPGARRPTLRARAVARHARPPGQAPEA